MGLHNRITRERYKKIKTCLKKPEDDIKAVEVYGISYTTARQIRNTKDYDEYCERVFRYHGHPKRKQNIWKTSPDVGKFNDGEGARGIWAMAIMSVVMLGGAILLLLVGIIVVVALIGANK